MFILKTMLISTVIVLSANAAMAAQTGVVGLYKNGAGLDEAAANALGCSVQGQGAIFAQQGKTKIDQPDQFVVLACDQPVLGQRDSRSALADLFDGGANVALFEGALAEFDVPDDQPAISERQYVLKLGYYNNLDLTGRASDLQALDRKVSDRDGRWATEAFLNVYNAMGVATPDEVVILYYDSAEIADRFREENQDILVDVGTFNAAHLTGFAYLVGLASR
jgi:hypothetical protein